MWPCCFICESWPLLSLYTSYACSISQISVIAFFIVVFRTSWNCLRNLVTAWCGFESHIMHQEKFDCNMFCFRFAHHPVRSVLWVRIAHHYPSERPITACYGFEFHIIILLKGRSQRVKSSSPYHYLIEMPIAACYRIESHIITLAKVQDH